MDNFWDPCLQGEENDQALLEQRLAELFVYALNENTAQSWRFFANVMKNFPRDHFLNEGSSMVSHYISRSYKILETVNESYAKETLGILRESFPTEMETLGKDSLGTALSRLDMRSQKRAEKTGRTVSFAIPNLDLANLPPRSHRSPLTKFARAPDAHAGLFKFPMEELYQHDVPNMRPSSAIAGHVSARFRRINSPGPQSARVSALAVSTEQGSPLVLGPPPRPPSHSRVGASPRHRPLSGGADSSGRPISTLLADQAASSLEAAFLAQTPVTARSLTSALAVYPDSPESLRKKAVRPISARAQRDIKPSPVTLPQIRSAFNMPLVAQNTERESGAGKSKEPVGELALCRTADEVVEFFSRSWPGDPVKFVYLTPANTGILFRPYDLVVADEEIAKREHYTISQMGVVHVVPGVPTEVISLGDWVREATLFNLLVQIDFFKNYLMRKAFILWHANVRFKMFCATRKKTSGTLFWANTAFLPTLKEIELLCDSIRTIKFMSFTSGTLYTHELFTAAHQDQKKAAKDSVADIASKVEGVIDAVIGEILRRTQWTAETSTPSKRSTSGAVRSKSMVQERDEYLAKIAAISQAADDARRLGSFIRLVDVMTVETLVDHAVASTHALLQTLTGKQERGMFQTVVSIGERGLVFTPDKEMFITSFRHGFRTMINTCASFNRVVNMRSIKPYMAPETVRRLDDPTETEIYKVSALIESSPLYVAQKEQVETAVAAMFDKVIEDAKVLEPLQAIVEFKRQWNVGLFEKRNPSVTEITGDFKRVKQWETDVARMRVQSTVDMYFVDSKSLKANLTPIPTDIMKDLKGYLAAEAGKRCLATKNDFDESIKQLSRRPDQLKAFAEFVQQLNEITERTKTMYQLADDVTALYQLMDEYEVEIVIQSQILMEDLEAARIEYDNKHASAATFAKEELSTQNRALDAQILHLEDRLSRTVRGLSQGMFVDPTAAPRVVLDQLEVVNTTLKDASAKASTFTEWQHLFRIEKPHPFGNLKEALEQYGIREEIWTSLDNWNTKTLEWNHSAFRSLKMDEVEKDVSKAYQASTRMGARVKGDPVVRLWNSSVEEFRLKMPILRELGNPDLRDRHWKKIFAALSRPFNDIMSFTLSDLVTYDIFEHRSIIQEISATASGEAALEDTLNKIIQAWSSMVFDLRPYKKRVKQTKKIYVLGSVDEIISLLEDHQVTLRTITGSRFIVGLRKEVETWVGHLANLKQLLDEWLQLQRHWMYLDSIFTQSDIREQIPHDYELFNDVHETWVNFMYKIHSNPQVTTTLDGAQRAIDICVEANRMCQDILKHLEDYLEMKRIAFPRFYFLSNDELLQILAKTKDPRAVQPHLTKCFENMAKLEFAGEKDGVIDINGMESSEGEVVGFVGAVKAKGNVEVWLKNVENAMRACLAATTRGCWEQYLAHQGVDVLLRKFPAQVVLLVEQLAWTREVEAALNSNDPEALSNYRNRMAAQQERLIDLARGGALTALERSTLVSLIVLDVHAKDVVDRLIQAGCESPADFEWQKQLRYYWGESKDDTVVVRQTNASFLYNNEYLGNTARLVISPLTERCYLTLTSALNLYMGGAPMGPAGTGKTETTKDLAKALARQCVVFNCSEGLDFKIMARFFAGLAQAGAWACFDEFNRIELEVLSVVAIQILTIQQALMARKTRFGFEGREISLNWNYGCFVTMNPGYAGRTELPDNLMALLRPVAMMIPDYALIAEIILLSEGFKTARVLASKMVTLYRLSSEQLSQQHHYDFGLRALKSVLVMAGALKRSKEGSVGEDIVLIRAMRDANVPKFLAEDVPLFMALVGDLFPGVIIPDIDHGLLSSVATSVLEANQLEPVPDLLVKVIQLDETMAVRHGVMLVGATGSGKTTCMKTLAATLSQIAKTSPAEGQRPVVVTRLNPKALSIDELYGAFDANTHAWSDGLVASLVRDINAIEAQSDSETRPIAEMSFAADVADVDPAVLATARKWITFDGPVDSLWIENMNTVLDDNRMLCLKSGERIRLTKNMTLLFEVDDLSAASPATVSRCGMVFLEPANLGWRPILKTWARRTRLAPTIVEHVCALLTAEESVFDDLIKQQVTHWSEYMHAVPVSVIETLLAIVESSLAPHTSLLGTMDGSDVETVAQMVTAFALVWAIGGNLDTMSRVKFNKHVRDSQAWKKAGLPAFPSAGDVFDYLVEVNEHGAAFIAWTSQMKPFVYDPARPMFDVLVPTVDTTRALHVLSLLVASGRSVLITGETGTGKSVIVHDLLRRMKPSEEATVANAISSFYMNFSAATTSRGVQETLESKLVRKGLSLRPGDKYRQVIFIDDFNMPKPDKNNSQPALELVRQTLDNGGFYDRKKFQFLNVMETQLIAACSPVGGGAYPVAARTLRQFAQLALPEVSPASMTTIYGTILQGFFARGGQAWQSVIAPLAAASVDLFQRMKSELLPTPSRSHYTFNLRHLAQVIQGMLQIHSTELTSVKTPGEAMERIVQLWTHECLRVFQDRLIDNADRAIAANATAGVLEKHFAVKASPALMDVLYSTHIVGVNYVQIADAGTLKTRLDEHYNDYKIAHSLETEIVLFSDAMKHVLRIMRILRQPRGSALLVGQTGSGRKTLTRLVAHILDYKVKELDLRSSYTHSDFRDDLKEMFDLAGRGTNLVFLFSDTQILEEAFLEDIASALNTGEVPNMYTREELDALVVALRPNMKELGVDESRDSILGHFISQVRLNLHFVLCMSPVGNEFRNRCRAYPALVNCCTVDWFDQWPETALLEVAMHAVQHLDIGLSSHSAFAQMCVYMQRTVADACDVMFRELRRATYFTPSTYLDMIAVYGKLLRSERARNASDTARFRNGLDQLAACNRLVSEMKKQLEQMQPVLEASALEASKLLKEVSADQAAADEVRANVAIEEAAVEKTKNEMAVLRDEAQADLDEAMPAYNDALRALGALNRTDLNEVKSYITPPPAVMMVLEAVCLLQGVKPSWDEAKKMMNQADFIVSLERFDKDSIPPSILRALQRYIQMPNFNAKTVEHTSVAAKSLCMWVLAIDSYATVYAKVLPKREKVKASQERLEATERVLNEKRAALAETQARVDELQRKYNDSLTKQANIQESIELTRVKLTRAEKLISSLDSESSRWTESLRKLDIDAKQLWGNMLISAAFIGYLGPFSNDYRSRLVDLWISECERLKITLAPGFSLATVLGDPVTMRTWTLNDLPSDKQSIENAIMALNGVRWPLFVDPQGQANRWIKRLEQDHGLIVTKMSSNFLRILESAVTSGVPILIENVEETLDPMLDPLLNFVKGAGGSHHTVRIGDSDVFYNEDFRLYMTCNLSNPNFLPEVFAHTNIVNFTVTSANLQDQLLGNVVRCEHPALQSQRLDLVVQIANFKNQLVAIEDQILTLLTNAGATILDNDTLIQTLDSAKLTALDVNKKVKDAEVTAVAIDEVRNQYLDVAQRGAILYFVTQDMALVDSMYQYSISFFLQLYDKVIKRGGKSGTVASRVSGLVQSLTVAVYDTLCQGVFKKDATLLAFFIAVQIQRQRGEISPLQWSAFLTGPNDEDVVEESAGDEEEAVSWIPARSKGRVKDFVQLLSPSLDLSTLIFSPTWEPWWKADNPAVATIDGWSSMSAFDRLLLVRFLREEKTMLAIAEFVRQELGAHFVETSIHSLRTLYDDSTASAPLILILSPGADPTAQLLSLAQEVGRPLRLLSLGQGQGDLAASLIAEGRATGAFWVCLQNCHLGLSWLPVLERIVYSMAAEGVDENFRLWLTSMPTPSFPPGILQAGLKFTNERPVGLRSNLQRTFAGLPDAVWQGSGSALPTAQWRRLLFGLAFFHGIIQERRNFGPIGWAVPYDWTDSDLQVSLSTLRSYVDEGRMNVTAMGGSVPFAALKFMIGEIMYGGRITDAWDNRILHTILQDYLSPSCFDPSRAFNPVAAYTVPSAGDSAGVLTHISSMPLVDPPEVFGLNANASISKQTKEARTFITSVVTVQPRTSPSGSLKPIEQSAAEIGTVLLERLPAAIDVNRVHPTSAINVNGSVSSLGIVLSQEVVRFNHLLEVIRSSLEALGKAVKGLVVMSSDLEQLMRALLYQQVPVLWAQAAYPSLKPLPAWIADLCSRVSFFRDWLENGPPKSFWLPAFFFPQGFLTAVLQTHARIKREGKREPIDTLQFRVSVTDMDERDVRKAPRTGAYIHGLFMEGARWNRANKCISECRASELVTRTPVLWLEPVSIQSLAASELGSKKYTCPVYKTTARAGALSTTGRSTNFIISVDLPTKEDPSVWIKRGVALVCQLND